MVRSRARTALKSLDLLEALSSSELLLRRWAAQQAAEKPEKRLTEAWFRHDLGSFQGFSRILIRFIRIFRIFYGFICILYCFSSVSQRLSSLLPVAKALVKLLGDEDPEVSAYAAWALSGLGEEQVLLHVEKVQETAQAFRGPLKAVVGVIDVY